MADKTTKPKTTAKTEDKTAKPVTAAKTETKAKSATSAKTATTSKPVTAAKTETKAKPAAAPKTATASKTEATARSTTTAKSTSTTKPAAADKTETKAKPATSTKTATTSKSVTADKTETKAKSVSATKTDTASKSTTTAKSETAAKPVNTAKTEATAKTAATAKSTAAKPIATPKTTGTKNIPHKKTTQNTASKKAAKRVASTYGTSRTQAAVRKNNKKSLAIIISITALILILALTLGIVLGTRGKGGAGGGGDLGLPAVDENTVFENDYAYKATSSVGVSGNVLGQTPRIKPVAEIKDGGLPSGYPTYGYTLRDVLGSSADKVAARNALISEANKLAATGTANAGGGGGYTWMDENGLLYSGTVADPVPTNDAEGNQKQLYKHTASVGLYLGDVADDEPGIIKEITMRPRGYNGYGVTGVYAPAGEVIKIEISEEDMNATGGLVIHIGQALYNGQANNIWTEKNQMQRIPVLLNTMAVNKNTATLKDGVYTAYVGSFIGGPLYIRNVNSTYTVKISGGVAYSHFILGYTTPEEFEANSKTSAPYFDLEVWDQGVLHSGPKRYAQSFSYDDLYKAAVLWEKVALVTTSNSYQGIVFLYDPFVAAGAAVAFPGRRSVNCPMGWMSNSLNYNTIVNYGAWGNFHEYHHNFQGYGVGNGGEVTNNGMTLVSYALFTKISAARGISNFGAQGLSGWNRYTTATFGLEQVLKIARANENPENGNQGLSIYSTLLHNFGADNYIKAKVQQQQKHYGQTYTGYLKAWQDITHNDMTYFFKDVLRGITDSVAQTWSNPEYSMFVPVSSVYQTGRSYMYDGVKKYFTTMRPYTINYGADFTVDLREYTNVNGQYSYGSIVIPDGFTYRIKNIQQPEHGTISQIEDKVYKFTPDSNISSGKIIVTLEITKNDGAFKVDDVDLVLEFEQTHETTKQTLVRTTYTYAPENMITDAEEAFKSNYGNYSNKVSANHANPVQNSNTDIWFYPDNDKYHDSPYVVKNNTIAEVSGKLYFEEEGRYRVYLRGRMNCAVFYSTNDRNYVLGATIKMTQSAANTDKFRPSDPNSYFDIDVGAQSWVYFKEVLVVQSSPMVSYIGLGYVKWTLPTYTSVDEVDENGNPILDENGNHITHWYDNLGNEITDLTLLEKIDPIPPSANANPAYITAFRTTYEIVKTEFETDYFYKRTYKYNYNDNLHQNKEQTIVSTNYSSGISWNWSQFNIANIADGNRNTFIHTKNGWGTSESKPLEFVLDLGSVKNVNRMTIYTQYRPNGDYHAPKNFTLYGSIDGENFFTVGVFENVPRNNTSVTVNFDERQLRYYKLVITGSTGGLMIISEIELWRIFEINGGDKISPDDDSLNYKGRWQYVQTNSSFGHVYVGKEKDSITFEFTGTRLAVLSSNSYQKNFEVYIDGVKVDSVGLKEDREPLAASYISALLEAGRHSVEIKCTGEANIDSIVVFN